MIFTTTSVKEFSQGKKCSEIIGHLLRVLFMSWVFFVPQDELTENQEIIQTYRLHIAQDINQDNLALFCQSYNRWHYWNPDLGPIHILIIVIWADLEKFFFFLLNAVGEIWRLRGLSWDLMKIQSKHWSRLIGCLFLFFLAIKSWCLLFLTLLCLPSLAV